MKSASNGTCTSAQAATENAKRSPSFSESLTIWSDPAPPPLPLLLSVPAAAPPLELLPLSRARFNDAVELHESSTNDKRKPSTPMLPPLLLRPPTDSNASNGGL